jgi:phosphatidylserine/phosphatidylglycerophosphate/cardiolipin synthase-like enzyme
LLSELMFVVYWRALYQLQRLFTDKWNQAMPVVRSAFDDTLSTAWVM